MRHNAQLLKGLRSEALRGKDQDPVNERLNVVMSRFH